MSSFVGRMLKSLAIRPRIKGKTWAQLCAGSVASRDNFLALIEQETPETAGISSPGEMSVLDTLAHLTVANSSIANRLTALRTGADIPPEPPDLFPGHGALQLAEMRDRYSESWNRFAEAAAQPIESDRKADHDFFGEMNAREWVVLMAYHHEYHARKVDRVKRSPAYRQAQGVRW